MTKAVRVQTVESYEDRDGIEAFVEGTLDMDASIAALLGNGAPDRLIVVKPNWVQEAHEYEPDIWECVITHPNLILTVVRALARRMDGKGTICVCDGPHTYASFDGITARGHFKERFEELRTQFPEMRVELLDLRREVWLRKEEVVVERKKNTEDPRGYVRLDLSKDSLFFGHPGEGRYYGADYVTQVVNEHHAGERQEYLLAASPMACDLFINLPKMKTHKKTGITCSLKNLVGTNGDKNWLPHHVDGCPGNQGDEFPDSALSHSIERHMKKVGMKIALNVPLLGAWLYRKMRNAGKRVFGDSEEVIRNGNWSGNDTCWRMALDLNRCLLYGNMDGSWREADKPKPYLTIVDGVVGGEGNGPLSPDPVSSNVLVSGTNPAAVDATVSQLMGFSPNDLPILRNAFETHRWPIADGQMDEILVEDGRCEEEVHLSDLEPALPRGFRPHFGWTQLLRGQP